MIGCNGDPVCCMPEARSRVAVLSRVRMDAHHATSGRAGSRLAGQRSAPSGNAHARGRGPCGQRARRSPFQRAHMAKPQGGACSHVSA